jgi:hypothetical protein
MQHSRVLSTAKILSNTQREAKKLVLKMNRKYFDRKRKVLVLKLKTIRDVNDNEKRRNSESVIVPNVYSIEGSGKVAGAKKIFKAKMNVFKISNL